MSAPTLNYVSCPGATDGHRMAYWQWGDAQAAHVIVCVHGLSRQGRDFDVLAQALVARAKQPLRVICPDVVGRGRSDWLADPMGYQIPTYAADMLAMLEKLRGQAPIDALDWLGTSMGGLIGMAVCVALDTGARETATAGQAGSSPLAVRRFVLNDVGPAIQWQALQRIGTYLGRAARFETVQQAADAMWAISSSFGPHTPEQWLALSQAMVRPSPEGGVTLHYDPAIAVPFRAVTAESTAQGEAALWRLYDQIKAHTLLVRGAQSDLLARDTAVAMTTRGPRARLVEFQGVGHAPTFVNTMQIEVAASFLLRSSADEKPDGRTR